MYGFGLSAACIGLPLIAFGAAICFFGYTIFKFSLRVIGFFIGAAIGVGIAAAIFGSRVTTAEVIISALIFGAVGAFLAVPLHFVFTFLGGGALGSLVVVAGYTLLSGSASLSSLSAASGLAVVAFVITGVLAVVIEKYYIIVSSALSGAFSVAAGINMLIMSSNPYTYYRSASSTSTLLILGALVLAVAGMYVQFKRAGTQPAGMPLYQAPVAGSLCGFCGWNNTPGVTFCARCGQPLGGARPVPPPPAFQQPVQVCLNCQQPNPPGTKFCARCGQPMALPEAQASAPLVENSRPQPPAVVLPPAVSLPAMPEAPAADPVCPRCGKPNPAAAVFCGGCGLPLKESSSPM